MARVSNSKMKFSFTISGITPEVVTEVTSSIQLPHLALMPYLSARLTLI